MMDIYKKIKELGYEIPEPPPISGQGPTNKGIPIVTGKVGTERTIEEGQEAARICALNAISVLHDYLGDLNKIKSLVKILAFVASDDNFNQQPKVVDGASKLLADIFGEENGIGARSAIGVKELPGNITVEIEFVFKI